ncbi:DUF123 domain-containing protein [Candidatus Zixiibacteriota bacterium]
MEVDRRPNFSPRGCYILIIELDDPLTIQVGRLGSLFFDSGYYAYVGSALGGLRARLGRHQRSEKRLFWHIDYLLQVATPRPIIWAETTGRIACNSGRFLSERLVCITGFGSSDCSCKSHLFCALLETDLIRSARRSIQTRGLIPRGFTLALKKSLT